MTNITNQAEFNSFFYPASFNDPSEFARIQLLKFYTLVKEYDSGLDFPVEWLNEVPLFSILHLAGAFDLDERTLYYIYKGKIAKIHVCESVMKEILG